MDLRTEQHSNDPLEKGGEYGILEGMKKRKRKGGVFKLLVVLVVIGALGYAGYWFADRQGWLFGSVPSRPPTASERARMQEIERTSNEIAPNAVPGAGVRPRGSLPPAEPLPMATTTSTSTEAAEEDEASADSEATTPEDLP